MDWVSRIKNRRRESVRNNLEAQKDNSMPTPAAEEDIARRIEFRGTPYTSFEYVRDKLLHTLRLGGEPEVERAARIRDEYQHPKADSDKVRR